MPSGFEIAEQRIKECDGISLDLSGLGLTKIPESIKDLVNLKWLDLAFNCISDFSELATLINLKWFYASGNKTTGLPSALQDRINSGDLYSDLKQKGAVI